MNNEVYEEQRPVLYIEQPPDWRIEEKRREREEEGEENRPRVIIVDMGTGEEPSEKNENGAVIIEM